jgi:crotonobetainyl-CoA:carnitine CoA-transferase CaiB-like acyl-CoA transferase
MRRQSMLEAKKLQLETEGVTVRDSEFNWGAGPFSTRRLATATRKVMTVEAPAGVNEAYR